MDYTNHPCFNKESRHSHGRIHLPVAPQCNLQCNFCDRKFDCVNETRPGVTSAILSPYQALYYLEQKLTGNSKISVVGIAGPGDPFANPDETLLTLKLVREKYPHLLLCVATNGIDLAPYADDLARLAVSHVTVTVNALDPAIAERIYAWVRTGKRVYRGIEAAEVIIEKQKEAIRLLADRGITIKINSIIIPGINDTHIPFIAETMAKAGAQIFNAIPLYKNPGSAFAYLDEPSKEMVEDVRSAAGNFLPQMTHCMRCRADAAGLLTDIAAPGIMQSIVDIARLPYNPYEAQEKKYIAVASREGLLINEHLGRVKEFFIYSSIDGSFTGKRLVQEIQGENRWDALADLLCDCRVILVSAAGETPKIFLRIKNIQVLTVEGLIDDVVAALVEGRDITKTAHVITGRSCPGPQNSNIGCM